MELLSFQVAVGVSMKAETVMAVPWLGRHRTKSTITRNPIVIPRIDSLARSGSTDQSPLQDLYSRVGFSPYL
jgi:hypothetical protein